MQDKELALALLSAESEAHALAHLKVKGLLDDPSRWRPLGRMPNNQSVVQAQQTNSAAALVEKCTNGWDAILLRWCKAKGIDPRGPYAPENMSKAVEEYFGELSTKDRNEIRKLAEENLVLYATGSKPRPCISLYDAGEGQLPKDFASTFCSLIFGSEEGSYKGAVPFVQGRFNMGGTGVLPFCGDDRNLQLIVSRVPADVAGGDSHEWGFTVFCFFPSKASPEWRYLTGTDGEVMTAGTAPLGLVPKMGAGSGEICAPRERNVPSGTLVKMYDYKAPRSNVCGELFKKLEEYLLRPMLPLRIIECRTDYKANVMGVTVWNRLAQWGKDKLEPGFEDGASIAIPLSTGEVIPAAIRVFKSVKGATSEDDQPQTGLRALVNGQSHARREAQFFRTKAIDKEHIAGSMLVTLDCSSLSQSSRNQLFMSNREMFRDEDLLKDLFRKLQQQLRTHKGLVDLNQRRYEEKVADATSDDDGISALEELLMGDPTLADMFWSNRPGKVAAKTADISQVKQTEDEADETKEGEKREPFVGTEFPSFFRRADGSMSVTVELPCKGETRVSFKTDVKNDYFAREKHRGQYQIYGSMQPSGSLFNGRLTFTLVADKKAKQGDVETMQVEITDDAGTGPFKLDITATLVPEREKQTKKPKETVQEVENVPSRPDILEQEDGPEEPPLKIQINPGTKRLQLVLNKTSKLLVDAKSMRPPAESAAVDFVFKYGLALTTMSLLDQARKTPAWAEDEAACRDKIEATAAGIGRIIVPLCLTLPSKLPKAA